MSNFAGRSVTSATVSNVIVRACARCQGPRSIGEPCAACGNPDPPVVHDLGVMSAYYRNPFRRAWWHLVRAPLAARRARAAARFVPDGP